jgi:iron only hydrogenase large subunit-like protein
MQKEVLKFPLNKKEKYIAMLAPSFVVDFSYPDIISQLKELGFDRVVELTFGAKMINRNYHKILEKSKNKNGLVISSVCPGVVETIKANFPEYKDRLIKVDSPMIAMAKICRKSYPEHKIVFFAPCNFKKTEAGKSKHVDYVLDFKELADLLKHLKIRKKDGNARFDKFYNDYTKIYPISGGLSKTANLKDIIELGEVKIIDGMAEVSEFLKNPDKEIRFLDVTFCKGGCIGGPQVNSKLPILLRKNKVMKYMKTADREKIPENRKGVIERAKGISFKAGY